MHGTLRKKLLGLLVLVALVSMLAPVAASTHQPLSLRKSKYVMDGSGQVWLTVVLANDGSNSVSVLGLAPAKAGPWTTVDQIAAPGATVRSAMKVKEGATALWVDSSQGILRFDLPHAAR
jgi:hypothetical protein